MRTLFFYNTQLLSLAFTLLGMIEAVYPWISDYFVFYFFIHILVSLSFEYLYYGSTANINISLFSKLGSTADVGLILTYKFGPRSMLGRHIIDDRPIFSQDNS